jgi:hypothetical protein
MSLNRLPHFPELEQLAFAYGRGGMSCDQAGHLLQLRAPSDQQGCPEAAGRVIDAFWRGRQQCPPDLDPVDESGSFLDGWFRL